MQYKLKNFEAFVMPYLMGASTLAVLTSMGAYAYLGVFSRYLGDDYCEAMLFQDTSPVGAVIERYTTGHWPRATMRYSNLLFEGYSELLGRDKMPITIVAMTLLWAISLVFCVREIRRSLKVDWSLQTDLFLGSLIAFFSFLLAPNLFQTVYWRSAMMTHFAPLVFGSFLTAFLVNQMRLEEGRSVSMLAKLMVLLAAFIIAGFSEPPTTTALTALPLIMLMVWVWGKSASRPHQLSLLLWTFTGVFLGLLVMLLSPATVNATPDKSQNFVQILGYSFLYSYLFIADSVRSLPLPLLISALIPLMLVLFDSQIGSTNLIREKKRLIVFTLLAIPILAWMLIAASFSPSVYGQGFPEARVRFLARTGMIVAVMLEGSLLGLLLKDLYFEYKREWSSALVVMLFSILSIIYPLRLAFHIFEFDVPEYRSRAQAWDERQANIFALRAQGQTDLVIRQLDGISGIKELDDKPDTWVNRCAAEYYGVSTISAVTEK